MSTYIFDLDGTLANCDHRQDFALNKDWETFHSLCHLDEVYPKIKRLLLDLADEGLSEIIMVTGRDDSQRAKTLNWLSDNGIGRAIDQLFMRPLGDHRPDHEYKLSVVDSYFGSREMALEAITCWFEDRDNLVANLRDAGFTILQVKAGAY